MSKRALLLVLGLFVLGLLAVSLVRERSAEHAAVNRVVEAGSAKPANDTRNKPDIRFQDETGRTRSLADFFGRYVLVNIWATWCAPCRKEMPSLDALQRAMNDAPFDVVAISIDTEGVPAARKFYQDIGLRTLKIYTDTTSGVVSSLAVTGIPTSILIDGSGREMWRIAGPVAWDKPEVVARLQRDASAR